MAPLERESLAVSETASLKPILETIESAFTALSQEWMSKAETAPDETQEHPMGGEPYALGKEVFGGWVAAAQNIISLIGPAALELRISPAVIDSARQSIERLGPRGEIQPSEVLHLASSIKGLAT